jgi:hypothetical protein
LALRYDCCGPARRASDSFALPEQLIREVVRCYAVLRNSSHSDRHGRSSGLPR